MKNFNLPLKCFIFLNLIFLSFNFSTVEASQPNIEHASENNQCGNGHTTICSRCNGCVYSRVCNYGCRCWGY